MPIAAVITAPTRPLPATRGSPLNPFNLPRAPSSHSLKTPTHTHLSNLDRLLQKPNLSTQPNSLPLTSTTKIRYTSTTTSDGGGLFSALNLPSLFPSLANPKSEMSPRSLTKLQRLLSNTQRLSPKNSIASRWHLFHGSTNWAGLIHPHLDDNLRRELVRYGDLVQAAYHAFHSNPTASASRHRPLVLPDRFYRSTKSLFASSSIDLPNWVDGLAPWMTQRSSWIGYVAVCDNDREIQRMGRRDIVIALRGTATCLEWAENFRAGLTSIDSSDAKAASGFHSLHKTPGPHVPSLSAAVVEEIRRLIELYKGEELSISITGHSLGGALALLVADELSTCIPDAPPIAVYSFGGPKVGNRAFADKLEKNGVKVLRVVNPNDVVTRVPGVELGKGLGEKWGSHVGTDGYVHVGKELSVDSKVSPYLRPNADPACCHDLESYLHLVDGFTGTGCPFRSEAKRSLVRLMSQQRPNVKRLYVNRAKSLALDRFEPAVAMASPTTVSGCLVSPSA